MNDRTFRSADAEAAIRAGRAGELTLALSGFIDEPRPEPFLEPIFEAFDRDTEAAGVHKVLVDLTALTFLNSSGIKLIANWVKRQVAKGDDARPEIVFCYLAKVTWQRSTVKALAAMTGGKVTGLEVAAPTQGP